MAIFSGDIPGAPFFERPISAILAAFAIGAMIWPVLLWLWRRLSARSPAPAALGG
jgi:putative tricarboxylic transport membrane protein